MFRRASGQNIHDREFDFDDTSDSEDNTVEHPKNHAGGHVSSDLERKPEWTMKNEGPGLESSDEDEDGVGRYGENYTMTELRIMAKWISRHTTAQWAEKSPTQRWEPITQIVSRMKKITSEETT